MSASIGAVRSTNAPALNKLEVPQPGAANAATLLPAPLEVGGDAMMALMVLMSKGREVGKQVAQARVTSNNRERKEAIAKELQAYQEAARARESGGFWGKLGKTCTTLCKVAAVVGAVAATVSTAGTGAPFALALAGAALSASGFALGETRALQKLGLSDKEAGWVGLGLSLGGAACSVGSSLAAGAIASQTADAAGKATEGADKVFKAIKYTQVGAGAVGGAAGVAAGVATIKAASYEADATDHLAEALSQQLAREKLERMLRQLLGELEEDDKSAERAIGSLRQAIEMRGNTLMAASVMRA